jgi:hypothetical protein
MVIGNYQNRMWTIIRDPESRNTELKEIRSNYKRSGIIKIVLDLL